MKRRVSTLVYLQNVHYENIHNGRFPQKGRFETSIMDVLKRPSWESSVVMLDCSRNLGTKQAEIDELASKMMSCAQP